MGGQPGYMPGPGNVNGAVHALFKNTSGTDDEPRFLVHSGDLAYAWSNGITWEHWGTQIEEVARRVPYMVSLGNHEYDHLGGANKDPSNAGIGFHPWWGNYGDDSNGECGVPVV